MAPRLTQFAHIEGLNELRRLISPIDALVATPWKMAMTQIAEDAANAARANAPIGRTGHLKAKIYAKVQKSDMPRWAAVRSRGTRKSLKYPRGYPYPRLLNYSAKHGHQGWFDNAITPVFAKAAAALAIAGNEIIKIWSRGR